MENFPPSHSLKIITIEHDPPLSTTTTVVRLRRSKGQVVQDCTLYIGRACYRGGWTLPQSKWYNYVRERLIRGDRSSPVNDIDILIPYENLPTLEEGLRAKVQGLEVCPRS